MTDAPDTVEVIARAICPETPDGTDRMVGDDGTPYPAGRPHWMAHTEGAQRILSALDAAGWAVVPKAATPEITEAVKSAVFKSGPWCEVWEHAVFVATHKAQPHPTTGEGE